MFGFGSPTPPAGGSSSGGGPAVDATARAAAATAETAATSAMAQAAAAQAAADEASEALTGSAHDSTARTAADAAQETADLEARRAWRGPIRMADLGVVGSLADTITGLANDYMQGNAISVSIWLSGREIEALGFVIHGFGQATSNGFRVAIYDDLNGRPRNKLWQSPDSAAAWNGQSLVEVKYTGPSLVGWHHIVVQGDTWSAVGLSEYSGRSWIPEIAIENADDGPIVSGGSWMLSGYEVDEDGMVSNPSIGFSDDLPSVALWPEMIPEDLDEPFDDEWRDSWNMLGVPMIAYAREASDA